MRKRSSSLRHFLAGRECLRGRLAGLRIISYQVMECKGYILHITLNVCEYFELPMFGCVLD